METLPEIPNGSRIEVKSDSEGVIITWPQHSAGTTNTLGAVFLFLWLCGWGGSWIGVVNQMARRGVPPQPAFIVFTLLWLLGGIHAIRLLWLMLRATRPESLLFQGNTLRFNPGRTPFIPWKQQSWRKSKMVPPPKPIPPVEISRSDIRGFMLDRVGERQRLSFDRGAERIEIGFSLREPEREWLFAVLQKWHRNGTGSNHSEDRSS